MKQTALILKNLYEINTNPQRAHLYEINTNPQRAFIPKLWFKIKLIQSLKYFNNKIAYLYSQLFINCGPTGTLLALTLPLIVIVSMELSTPNDVTDAVDKEQALLVSEALDRILNDAETRQHILTAAETEASILANPGGEVINTVDLPHNSDLKDKLKEIVNGDPVIKDNQTSLAFVEVTYKDSSVPRVPGQPEYFYPLEVTRDLSPDVKIEGQYARFPELKNENVESGSDGGHSGSNKSKTDHHGD